MANRRSRKTAMAVALVGLIAGAACFSVGSGETPMETYVFNPIAIQPGPVTGDGPILLVNYPRALAAYSSTMIAYTQRAHEIAYYAFNQWADTPPRMLEPLLVQTLDSTGQFAAVVRAAGSGVAELRLDTELIALLQEFITAPSRVRLSVRVQLYDLLEHRVLATRVIEILQDTPSDDAYGAVRATNRALGVLLKEIADFVIGAVRLRGAAADGEGTLIEPGVEPAP